MSNRLKLVLIALMILVIVVVGFSLVDVGGSGEPGATTLLSVSDTDISGYQRAIAPYDWHFPADFGPHPGFQTEWWYYTGNMTTDDGRRFGFQFTIFRRAITPASSQTDSEWRSNQVYLAHFTVSDIEGDHFYHDQRLSRGAAGLAGATTEPRYRVWLEDWEIQALNTDASSVAIKAVSDDFAIDMTLEQIKPPALQGSQGLSPKSDEPGNASYYYSLTRLLTSGKISVKGETFTVTGYTWKDHEFSTSALGAAAQGWDWFGLILDNDTEVMIGQIRMVDARTNPAFGGLMIYPDGSTEYLGSGQFTITPLDTWVSPHTGAEYPSGWQIHIETEQDVWDFAVTPLMLDQELANTDPSYWEGAVRISGAVSGYGYAELTGYSATMQDRF